METLKMVLYDLVVDGELAVLNVESKENISMVCSLDVGGEVERIYYSRGIFSLFTVLDKIRDDGYKVEFPRRDLTS